MVLPSGAHVEIGGSGFKLDEAYERITGRRCYVHGGRSIFAERSDITGMPGAQNIKADTLVWSTTRFDGEGQVVLDPADPDSQFRFYRSEGLNFRTAGQAKLNKSTVSTMIQGAGSSTTTAEGNADFEDISGTASTTTSTDRRLTAINTKIGASANWVPGLGDAVVDFYLYREGFPAAGQTVQGSSLVLHQGEGTTSGTDFVLRPGAACNTALISTGDTGMTADTTTEVRFYAYILNESGTAPPTGPTVPADARFQIVDVTNGKNDERLIASMHQDIPDRTAPTDPNRVIHFRPKTGHVYRFRVVYSADSLRRTRCYVDKITYGTTVTENTAKIEVWNQSAGATVTSKTITVDTASSANVATITFPAAAATNYRARVTRMSGSQGILLDKVIYHDQDTTANWTVDTLDLGVGPAVWAGVHAAAVDSQLFTYAPATGVWTSNVTLNAASSTNAPIYGLTHSDALAYALTATNSYSVTGGADTLYSDQSNSPQQVGIAVCQNRLWILTETNAASASYDQVGVYSITLDSGAPWSLDGTASETGVRYTQIPAGSKSADLTLRQRIASSPTGIRFFLNYAGVNAKVYEVDGSSSGLEVRELADLGHGVKATSIAYESGITFIGAQYVGTSTATDDELKPRGVLFAIDQNGVTQRIGFFRRDDPSVYAPVWMTPYQTDLFILQGPYIWRYSLVTGGLFLEYELEPKNVANARALAVDSAYIYAAYAEEIFVAGSVGTYRSASIAGGNSITTSIYDFGLPAVKKTLQKLEVLTDTMPAGTQVSLEYQLDQDGTWIHAGVHETGTTQAFILTETQFTTLQLRARLSSTNGTASPVLLSVTAFARAAEDEEYFDLVLLTEDEDSNFRIAGDQVAGSEKASHIVSLWRHKAVTTFRDGYASKADGTEDYLVTIEDLRVEQNAHAEGRTVVTLKVVK